MDGVLLHEMMHTRQFAFANPAMASAEQRYGLPEDINDDSIQAAFKDDPAYVRAWQDGDRSALCRRRGADRCRGTPTGPESADGDAGATRYEFAGAAEKWKPLDDIFLQMEGLGQWLIYGKYYVDRPHRVYSPDVALKAVRRGRKQWSHG